MVIEFTNSTISDLPNEPGIYMLMNDDELVYIGETKNIRRRCYGHKCLRNANIYINDKKLIDDEFNKVLFKEVTDEVKRKEIEFGLIHSFFPKGNEKI